MTEFLTGMGCVFCGFLLFGVMFLVSTVFYNCEDIKELKERHTSLAVKYQVLIKNLETDPEKDD